jgi:hypothetical protein
MRDSSKPTLLLFDFLIRICRNNNNNNDNILQFDDRSLEEKERDIDYQRKRVHLFRQLISRYPETRAQLLTVV